MRLRRPISLTSSPMAEWSRALFIFSFSARFQTFCRFRTFGSFFEGATALVILSLVMLSASWKVGVLARSHGVHDSEPTEEEATLAAKLMLSLMFSLHTQHILVLAGRISVSTDFVPELDAAYFILDFHRCQ